MRKLFFATSVSTILMTAIIVACSDDAPPAASSSSSGGGTSNPSPEAGILGDGSSSITDGPLLNDGEPIIPIDDASILPCLDDNAVMVDGGAGPTACPQSASCSAHCTSVRDHYKLGISQVAIDCIAKLPSCANVGQVRNCVDRALGRACKDQTAPNYCTPLVTSCDPNAGQPGSNIDQEGCVRFANGFTANGRTAFSTCVQGKVQAGTCPVEIIDCANQIRQ